MSSNRIAVVLSFVLALSALVSLSPAAAQPGQFPQAASPDTLRAAQGVLFDTSQEDFDPHWTFFGEWQLTCGPQPCVATPLDQIGFDIQLAMVRPDGGESHSHAFSDFLATAVSVSGDSLIIDGTIVGTGGIQGLTDVRLSFEQITGQLRFFFELPGNGHIVEPLGGTIVKSR